MDPEDFETEYEPAEPSDLGFDPYAGGYIDDDPIDIFDYSADDYFEHESQMIGGDSDLMNEY